MADLELLLGELAAAIEYPPAPAVWPAVRARIQPRPWVRWALAAAAVLVIAGAAAAAIPPVRETVAGWLGLRHLEIRHVETLPSPSTGERLQLGVPASLGEAGRRAGFTVLVPGRLGAPDQVFYDQSLNAVTLVYGNGPRYLVSELRAAVPTNFFGKLIGPGTTITQVQVAGAPGVWIAGSPHDVFLQLPDGSIRADRIRLAGNALLWERNGITYRLEGPATLDEALAIAGTV